MNYYRAFKQFIYRLLVPFININKKREFARYLRESSAIQLVVGAGRTAFPGWFSTDIDTLNVLIREDFEKYFHTRKIDKVLAEHMVEHLTPEGVRLFAKHLYEFSTPGVTVRIAVPDGFHGDAKYIEMVKPGGFGAGAWDHKHLLNYKSLSELFASAGFVATPVEYWDENRVFHQGYKDDDRGYISRSFVNDDRNKDGKPNYTSLIIDFTKK